MKLCSLHWAFLILEVLGNSCQPPNISESLFWKKKSAEQLLLNSKFRNSCDSFIVYVSAVHAPFEVLPVCFTCFYAGNFTEVTPWGLMTCSKTAICTVTGQGSLPYADSWVQAKSRAARTSMVLLAIYSPKARTNYLQLWGSARLLSGVPEGCIGKFHVQNNWKIYYPTEFSGCFLICKFTRTSRECKDKKLFRVKFLKSSVYYYEKDSPETSNDHIH